jgi:hypothetical protein
MDGSVTSARGDRDIVTGVTHDVFDFASFAMHTRLARA